MSGPHRAQRRASTQNVGQRNNNNMPPKLVQIPNQTQNATMNGIYNVANIAPPPFGASSSRPSRTSRVSQTQQQPQYPMNPMSPMNQMAPMNPVAPVAPVAPVLPTVPRISPINNPSNSSDFNALKDKINAWKEMKNKASVPQHPPAPLPAQQSSPTPQSLASQSLAPQSLAPQSPAQQQTENVDLTELRNNLEMLRRDIQNRTVNDQSVQKLLLDQNSTNGTIEQLKLTLNSFRGEMENFKEQLLKHVNDQMSKLATKTTNSSDEEHESIVRNEDLDDAIGEVKEEVEKKMNDLANNMKSALQVLSDRCHWMYGTVLHEEGVYLYESPDVNGRKKNLVKKGERLLLLYPQQANNQGVWILCRSVENDGQLTNSWVPIWTFTPEVMNKFANREPPKDEAKNIYLGSFRLSLS